MLCWGTSKLWQHWSLEEFQGLSNANLKPDFSLETDNWAGLFLSSGCASEMCNVLRTALFQLPVYLYWEGTGNLLSGSVTRGTEGLTPAAVCQVSRVFHLFPAGVGCTQRIQCYQLQTWGLAWTAWQGTVLWSWLPLKYKMYHRHLLYLVPEHIGDNIWQNIRNHAWRKTVSGVIVHWNRKEKKGKWEWRRFLLGFFEGKREE